MSAVKTKNLLGSTSDALSSTIFDNASPAPSLSAATFFVNFNSGVIICHEVSHKPSQFVDSQASLSVCLVRLLSRITPLLVIHNTAPFRSWCSTKLHSVIRHSKELTRSSPIFWNQIFSQNYVIDFLLLRYVLLISLVFPSLSILILFMTCAAKRGSQSSNGLSSEIRTLVLAQRKFWEFCLAQGKFLEFCLVVSLLSQPLQHDRWSCDHPQMVLIESLPPLLMCESPHLGVLTYSMHYRIPTWFCEIQDLWWIPQEMKSSMLWILFPFTTCRSRLTIPVVSENLNWKRIFFFFVSESRSRPLQSESSSSSNTSFRCCPTTPRPSTQAAHQLL